MAQHLKAKAPKWILGFFVVLLGWCLLAHMLYKILIFTASPSTNTQIKLTAAPNPSNDNIVVVFNLSGSFTTPTNGNAAPGSGGLFANGTVVYNGAASGISNHTG